MIRIRERGYTQLNSKYFDVDPLLYSGVVRVSRLETVYLLEEEQPC